MNIQKLLLLRVFCYDNLKNDDFEVTYLPLSGKAIVKDVNGDCILLVAKENNIVECYEYNPKNLFRTMQFTETSSFKNSIYSSKYEWKDLK